MQLFGACIPWMSHVGGMWCGSDQSTSEHDQGQHNNIQKSIILHVCSWAGEHLYSDRQGCIINNLSWSLQISAVCLADWDSGHTDVNCHQV